MELRVILALAQQVVSLMVASGELSVGSQQEHDDAVVAVVNAAQKRVAS